MPPESVAKTFEERITLWQAASAEEAIERAEADARQYAIEVGGSSESYLELAQCHGLTDVPGDGAEVFSLMRDSSLSAEEYLTRFFDTGDERQSQL